MAAVALLSGGLDSTVAAAYAARRMGLALALTVDYGQRSVAREIEAAAAIARFLKTRHRVVALPFLGEISSSALTDDGLAIPEPNRESLDHPAEARARAASVWVPNRNGIFIHVAAAFAQVLRHGTVVVGFNREEAETFPDNRPEFLEACTRSLAFTLDQAVRVTSPTKDLDKTGIVRLGLEVDAPLDRIWSCYGPGPEQCGRCESCMRLRRALERAGVWETIGPALFKGRSPAD